MPCGRETPMPTPISETMTCAVRSLTRGMVRGRPTAGGKGRDRGPPPRRSLPWRQPTHRTGAGATASSKLRRSLMRPVSAALSFPGGALTQRCTMVSSRSGSLWPSIRACRMARSLTPITWLNTEPSLRLASSSVFYLRWTWLDCSRTSCLRVRSNERSSCVGASGTKLARMRPCASRSANQSASAISVLRPGTFLT